MVEEVLAARGIGVSHESVRRWAEKFGREYSNRIRRRAPARGDKWHMDEVVITRVGSFVVLTAPQAWTLQPRGQTRGSEKNYTHRRLRHPRRKSRD
jgi:hypothetical protein